MKVIFNLALLVYVTASLQAQLLYTENFNAPSHADSIEFSVGWQLNDSVMMSGESYHGSIPPHNQADCYADLSPIDISLHPNALITLEFDHICKSSFFDINVIQYLRLDSNINGSVDSSYCFLDTSMYRGSAKIFSPIISFSEASYYTLWMPNLAHIVPNPSWWKHELIHLTNIQNLIGTASMGKLHLRFLIYDGGTPGSEYRYGWVIDNLSVAADVSLEAQPTSDNASIRVFPNPFTDHIVFECTGMCGSASYQVHSIDGKRVKQGVLFKGNTKSATINLEQLKTGPYLITLQTEDEVLVKKIFKR